MNLTINLSDNKIDENFSINDEIIDETLLEKINDQFTNKSNSDSNYVSETSTTSIEFCDTINNNKNKAEEMNDLIDFSEIISKNEENWLFDIPAGNYKTALNLTFSTLKTAVKIINEDNLIKTLISASKISDFFNIDLSPHQKVNKINNNRLFTSTPIVNKERNIDRNYYDNFTNDFVDNIDQKSQKSILNYSNTNISKSISPTNQFYDKKLNENRNTSILESSNQNKTFIKPVSPMNSIADCLDQDSTQSASIDSTNISKAILPINSINKINLHEKRNYSRNTAILESSNQNQTFIKTVSPINSIADSLDLNESDPESPRFTGNITRDISLENSPNPSPSSDIVISKQSFIAVKPNSRLSLLRQSLPRNTNTQNNRNSVVVRPREILGTQSKLIRQSIAVFPVTKSDKQSLSNVPSKLSKPSKIDSVSNITKKTKIGSIIPPKTVQSSMKPPQIVPVASHLSKTTSVSNFSSKTSVESIIRSKITPSSIIPSKTVPSSIIPPNVSQTSFVSSQSSSGAKRPLPSQSVPLLSPPSNNSDDNPLNRTFDREQFLLLKSVTNTAPLSTNNNNDGSSVYRLALTEEANLLQSTVAITTKTSAVPLQSRLKLPSRIQSRAYRPSAKNLNTDILS